MKIKGLNLGAMSENPKKEEEGIESGHDVGEPETNRRDRIYERCQRIRNKRKGLNLGAKPENPNQNKWINSRCDSR